jgi:hypothetical protein
MQPEATNAAPLTTAPLTSGVQTGRRFFDLSSILSRRRWGHQRITEPSRRFDEPKVSRWRAPEKAPEKGGAA